MGLKEILRDGELHSLLSETGKISLEKSESVASLCNAAADSLDTPEFFLPVLGVQGSGKSTLLNSLCFDRPVLPIDADETTAVPVEIRRRGPGAPEAAVLFGDGHEERIPLEQDRLNRYVHQELNPGNRLGIVKLTVESDAPFLEGGLVLVDLPGVGSLTETNQETTVNYLRGASGLICIIRTNPTVTTSEARDIKKNWRLRRHNTYFVQNIWNDEMPEDVEEGIAFNQDVVDRMAKELNISGADTDLESSGNGREQFRIMPVNAYMALKRRLGGGSPDPDCGYGPERLTELLTRLGADWKARLSENARKTLLGFIDSALADLAREDAALSDDVDFAKRRVDESHIEIRTALSRFRELHGDSASALGRLNRDVGAICGRWERIEGPKLRGRMAEVVGKGVTDGAHLNAAFADLSKESYAELTDRIQERISSFEDFMKEKFSDTSCISGPTAESADFDSSLEGEEGYRFREYLSSTGGALSALATFVLLANPLSIGAALTFATVAATFGKLLGGRIRQALANVQKDRLLPQIDAAVEKFLKSTADSVTESLGKFRLEYESWFENQCIGLEENAKAAHQSGLASLLKSAGDKKAEKRRIEMKIAALNTFRGKAETASA
ncbi:MAG: dynamin family protein [Deltaproteobacteria bacterium]|jgi:hypothetical protein|nr:dynamin family protein [Deltaproteobacteria bacterium]